MLLDIFNMRNLFIGETFRLKTGDNRKTANNVKKL